MDDHDHSEIPTPTLMRSARGAYARSIRAQLHAIGVDDLPRNGASILAGIYTHGGPRNELPSSLGVTKQAVNQVIDILVNRGYLQRSGDPDDRRRNVLELTETGRQAVDAVVRGADAVDRQLQMEFSSEQIESMRAVLHSLAKIKETSLETGEGIKKRARQLRHFSPIFPVKDMAAALAHYTALGFNSFAYEGGDGYGFANRDGIGLHFAADPDHDPARGASTYLYVRDANALYEEWSRPGIGGITRPVGPTDYDLLEGSHSDPDGNLIRFGSPAAE
jgi:DNA-binding MarR family transcriptional regulator